MSLSDTALAGTGRPRVLRSPTTDPDADEQVLAPWLPLPAAAPSLERDRIAEATRAGWEAGYQAARAEADAAARADDALARRALRDAVAAAARAAAATRTTTVATVASEAVELAVELAEALIGRELLAGDDLDRAALARALRLAPAGEDLVVRLCPGHDLDPADVAAMVPGASVRLVEDPSIARGDCVLEAGACRIDAQIAPALERARALLGADRSEAA